MVTRGLPSSFGMHRVFNARMGKRKKMCHCYDNYGGLVGLYNSSGRVVDAH